MNKTVNSNSKEILPVAKSTDRCELECEGRILCVSATTKIQNTEALNKELRISLTTDWRAVTLTDGEYGLVTAKTESVVSIVNEKVTPSVKFVVFANVTGCSLVSKNKAEAELEVCGWLFKENEIFFTDDADEGILYRTERFEIENVSCPEEHRHTLTNSNEARLPLKKVLDYSSCVTVNNVYPSQGLFQVDGDLSERIVALSDSGIFVTQCFTSPFSVEIACDCVNSDSTVDLYAQVLKTELTITDTDTRMFITETDIKFCYAVSDKKEIDGIVDCYSKTNELIVEENVNVVNTCSCFRSVRDKATASIKTESVIEEVLCASTPCVSDVTVIGEDALRVEGLINATVLYADETGVKTEKCEIPFSTTVAPDFDCTENFFPEIKVTALTARIRSATEVELTADLYVTVRGTNRHELRLISSVEKGAEKTDSDYAISLYIVKPGETVWDVAKALNTDEDTVFKLNPELSVPLKGGEKVLIYNEL